ncbi:hypothetical protein [Sphingomonas zeae]
MKALDCERLCLAHPVFRVDHDVLIQEVAAHVNEVALNTMSFGMR